MKISTRLRLKYEHICGALYSSGVHKDECIEVSDKVYREVYIRHCAASKEYEPTLLTQEDMAEIATIYPGAQFMENVWIS